MISTPCIKLCVVEPSTGFCLGCGRSGDEIGAWWRMSEDERIAVMRTLGPRVEAARLAAGFKPEG